MDKCGLRIKVLGARGSMAVSMQDRAVFGGSTSCYMVTAGDQTLFLDAGTGLLTAPSDYPGPSHILLSHLHLDHLLGLGMYPGFSQTGRETLIHVPVPAGQDPEEMLDRLYSPPFWPVSLRAVSGGTVRFLPLSFPLRIGDLTVEGIPGRHPGGIFLMKLSFRGKNLVYASDYEYEESSFVRLVDLARDADLVLYDGQYSMEELESRRGFGHSTPEYGLELMERSGAKRLWIIHHDPRRSDEELLAREARIGRDNVRFAREGDELLL